MKKERAPITVGMKVRWVNGMNSYTGTVEIVTVQDEIYEVARSSTLTTVHRRQIISRIKHKPKLKEVWVGYHYNGVVSSVSGTPNKEMVHFREVRRKK